MLGEHEETILVLRAHDPSGLWQESRALARPDFLSISRVSVSYYQPIRFARFDGKSVNRGLPVLDKARALDFCHRPEGSWALGTRMTRKPCKSQAVSRDYSEINNALNDNTLIN